MRKIQELDGDQEGICLLEATHVVAALRVQKGWTAFSGLCDGEPVIAFKRTFTRWEEGDPGEADIVACHSFNPWRVRKEFFALKTLKQAVAFFGEYGPFWFLGDEADGRGYDACVLQEEQAGDATEISLKIIVNFQKDYQHILMNPPKYWQVGGTRPKGRASFGPGRCGPWDETHMLDAPWGPDFTPNPGRPLFFTVTEFSVKAAIEATLFLSCCSQERFRECEHCRIPFNVERYRGQRFCDPVCGSKARVAKSRAKARAAKAGVNLG